MSPLADTITPYIGATLPYLYVLNAGIGWVEARLLRRFFSGRAWAVLWMIPANYASAWAGWLALQRWFTPSVVAVWLGPRPIERVNGLALGVWAGAFAVTLVVEAPFVWWATLPPRRRVARVALATVAVNAVSYLLVAGWFLQSFSLPGNATVTPLSDLPVPPAGTLYWVDPVGRVIARHFGPSAGPDRVVGRVKKDDFVIPILLDVQLLASGRVALVATWATEVWRDRPTPPGDVPPGDGTVLGDVGPYAAFPADYAGQSRSLRKGVLDLRPADGRQARVAFDGYRHTLTAD